MLTCLNATLQAARRIAVFDEDTSNCSTLLQIAPLYICHISSYIYVACCLLYAFVAESRIAFARSCQSNGQSGSKMLTAKWKDHKLFSGASRPLNILNCL